MTRQSGTDTGCDRVGAAGGGRRGGDILADPTVEGTTHHMKDTARAAAQDAAALLHSRTDRAAAPSTAHRPLSGKGV
ncbi:hypothetical protein [Streptomyces sp. NRRL S-1521]|uniref:hypothetical protein n=1 Tax=Streptomyces sp. NRRL S-1521 TaxID=1609100 RepID=UPI00074AD7FF|nr:hypothetical protein [Streptomyces sp. NRRL S-1521]KUL62673.1 hypothetical protein ADL30_04545 [Streptomyces sp. NRRL S-1521]